MAGPKGSRYYDVFLRHHVELVSGDEIIISEEGFRLLIAVKTEGSIVGASRKMKISYRKAWGLLREIERNLGFAIVGKRRGGKAGGMTEFTSAGTELIAAYEKLTGDLDSSDKEIVRTFFRSLNHIPTK